MIICHSRKHDKYGMINPGDFYENSVMVDISPEYDPDIIMNFSREPINQILQGNHFDAVVTHGCMPCLLLFDIEYKDDKVVNTWIEKYKTDPTTAMLFIHIIDTAKKRGVELKELPNDFENYILLSDTFLSNIAYLLKKNGISRLFHLTQIEDLVSPTLEILGRNASETFEITGNIIKELYTRCKQLFSVVSLINVKGKIYSSMDKLPNIQQIKDYSTEIMAPNTLVLIK